MKFSTGLRNGMLGSDSFKGLIDGGTISIYAGAVPADADAALGGATLLVEISSDGMGAGINLDSAASGGVISKDPGETWSGTVVGSGTQTATFFRHVASGDTGASSSTEVRVQGTVGLAGADMNLSDVDLVNGAPQTVDFYSMALPTL